MAKTPTEIASLARSHTKTALNVLSKVMSDNDAPHNARVSAATALLDRGWGKPAQRHEGSEDDGSHKLVIEIIDPTKGS